MPSNTPTWIIPMNVGPPISRRDLFAAAALAGLLTNPDCDGLAAEFARDAVEHADAMIAELDRRDADAS